MHGKTDFGQIMPFADALQSKEIALPLPQIRYLARPERTQQSQIINGFEKIRLSLPIVANKHIYMTVQLHSQTVEISEIRDGYLVEHEASTAHRHDDVEEAFVACQGHRAQIVGELHNQLLAVKIFQRLADELRIERNVKRFVRVFDFHGF